MFHIYYKYELLSDNLKLQPLKLIIIVRKCSNQISKFKLFLVFYRRFSIKTKLLSKIILSVHHVQVVQ